MPMPMRIEFEISYRLERKYFPCWAYIRLIVRGNLPDSSIPILDETLTPCWGIPYLEDGIVVGRCKEISLFDRSWVELEAKVESCIKDTLLSLDKAVCTEQPIMVVFAMDS